MKWHCDCRNDCPGEKQGKSARKRMSRRKARGVRTGFNSLLFCFSTDVRWDETKEKHTESPLAFKGDVKLHANVDWSRVAPLNEGKATARRTPRCGLRTPQRKHEQVALVDALHPPRAQENARTAVLDEAACATTPVRVRSSAHGCAWPLSRRRACAMVSAAAARCSSVHVPASLHPRSPARPPASPVQLWHRCRRGRRVRAAKRSLRCHRIGPSPTCAAPRTLSHADARGTGVRCMPLQWRGWQRSPANGVPRVLLSTSNAKTNTSNREGHGGGGPPEANPNPNPNRNPPRRHRSCWVCTRAGTSRPRLRGVVGMTVFLCSRPDVDEAAHI